jgi:hypothetical protein
MQAVKLLLAVDGVGCQGAQVSATVNGIVRAPFMQQRPPVVIVTPLPVMSSSTTRVCVTLRKPCYSLSSLCNGSPHCFYALLDSDAGTGCCGIDHV